MNENSNINAAGKGITVALDELYPFPNHPFKVLQDEAFDARVERILSHGVLRHIIIRPRKSTGLSRL